MSEEATLDEFVENENEKTNKKDDGTHDDWQIHRADEIMEITRGASPRPKGDPELFGGNIPWVKIGDVDVKNARYTGETEDTVTEKGAKKSKLVEEGTLLVSNSGTCGYPMFAGRQSCVHDGWLILRDYEDCLNAHYLYEYINGKQNYLKSLAPGSTQTNLNTSRFGILEIKTPPLPEQRKIATVLHTVDRAIEKTAEIIEELETVRRGTEQDLLSKGVLQDGSLRSKKDVEYKSSWVGEIPKEWDIRPYSELISDSSVGIVVKPTQYYNEEGEVPILRSKDISRDGIVSGEFEYMTQESNKENANSQLNAGDVITVRSGEPGLSCVVPSEFDGSNCADLLISTPGEHLDPHYAAMWINSRAGRKQIDRFQAGLAQKHFNLGALRKLKVAVPPIEEQKRIVETVASITEALDKEKQNQTRFERLKRGLMQDLLSGTVRTTDTDIEVPEEIEQYG
jgi:type I restriction enzyme S subunit